MKLAIPWKTPLRRRIGMLPALKYVAFPLLPLAAFYTLQGMDGLLFALDKKVAIPGGFSYLPDCRDINRQSGSGDHCGTSFGGNDAGSAAGGAQGFGGSESSGDGGGGGGNAGGGGD